MAKCPELISRAYCFAAAWYCPRKQGRGICQTFVGFLVGDVWFCAGQSNMAGSLRRADHPKNYPPGSVNSANYPALRIYSASDDMWLVCSPETVVSCSRVAFFFVRHVQRDVLVPMGVMVTAVGGSSIESWLNQPPYPTGNNYHQRVEPLVGFGLRGVIWYQGESNESDKRGYQPKLESLITGWRKEWKQGDFPVHYVQLPGLGESNLDNAAGGDGRAEIRQAFAETLGVTNTGMAVTIDVGTPGEHPPNKYDTGIRLARSVLKHVYRQENITACPLYRSHLRRGKGHCLERARSILLRMEKANGKAQEKENDREPAPFLLPSGGRRARLARRSSPYLPLHASSSVVVHRSPKNILPPFFCPPAGGGGLVSHPWGGFPIRSIP